MFINDYFAYNFFQKLFFFWCQFMFFFTFLYLPFQLKARGGGESTSLPYFWNLKIFTGTLRSYIIKENHISGAVREILWYTQIDILLLFYRDCYNIIPKISETMTKTKPQRRTPSVYSDEDGDNEVDRN